MIFYIGCLLLLCLVLWILKVDSDLLLLICEHFYSFTKRNTLAGKVVWITGASSGIGEALAHELASRGCKLVLSGRREDVLKAVKDKCVEIGRKYSPSYEDGNILVLPFDILNTEIHKQMVVAVIQQFSKIDVLVNNAGRSQRAQFVASSLEVTQEIINLDMMAPIYLTRAVLPHMITRKQGHIVGISSVAGKNGVPNAVVYSSAKHAINGFLHSLRCEVRTCGVNVTVVCPGPVETQAPMNSFVEKSGVKFGKGFTLSSEDTKLRTFTLSAERCAFLTAIAIDAKLHEVWITKNPILLITYLQQYFPTTAMYVLAIVFSKRS